MHCTRDSTEISLALSVTLQFKHFEVQSNLDVLCVCRSGCVLALLFLFLIFPRFAGFALCRPSGALLLVSFCNYFNKAQCSYFYVLYVPPRKASEEKRRAGPATGEIAIYDDVARVNISWNGNE